MCKATDELGYDSENPEIQKVASDTNEGVLQSQASEDLFNEMKNAKLVKGKARYRTPAKCAAVCISRKTASKRHRFVEIEAPRTQELLTAKLPNTAFKASPGTGSLPCSFISGPTEKPC